MPIQALACIYIVETHNIVFTRILFAWHFNQRAVFMTTMQGPSDWVRMAYSVNKQNHCIHIVMKGYWRHEVYELMLIGIEIYFCSTRPMINLAKGIIGHRQSSIISGKIHDYSHSWMWRDSIMLHGFAVLKSKVDIRTIYQFVI